MQVNSSAKWYAASRVTLFMGMVTLAGCSLDAKNPRAITEPDLQTPEALTALVYGVIGDSDQSFHRTVMLSGLLSDELTSSGTWPSWTKADREGTIDLDAPPGDGQNIAHDWWVPLQRARHLAEETYGRVQLLVPNPEQSELAAITRLYSGMAYREIGEFFCAAAYDGGPSVSREESLAIAAQHLTEAINVGKAAQADSTVAMAYLTRAKVNHSLGRMAEALSDARAVPNGFQWLAHYREAPQEFNGAWVVLNQLAQATVSGEFAQTDDPRIQTVANDLGPDQITPRFDQKKFSRFSDMPRGKWQEARLIEAEILLGQEDVESAVTLLNQVRSAAGLGSLPLTQSAADATAALRLERKHELFLEGHRMLDMRRWGLYPPNWNAGCVPLPRSETDNNPSL